MLSILVPVFNQVVVGFVEALIQSAKKSGLVFELIVVEDGSEDKFQKKNSVLSQMPEVRYLVHQHNLGRSAIRNFLASNASYNNLLFLDADGQLMNDQFISNYSAYLNAKTLISGGRIYSAAKPSQKEFILHWKYGLSFESQTASTRNLKPVAYFHSNNFLVPKSLMKEFPFDESFVKYGYEDLAWASHLQDQHWEILHIDNPVIHVGLDSNVVFLQKLDESMENLLNHISEPWTEKISLIKYFNILQNARLLGVYQWIFNLLKRSVTQNLLGENSNLWILQLYKLGLLVAKFRNQVEYSK